MIAGVKGALASHRSTLADYSRVSRAVGSDRVAADLANAPGNMKLEWVLPTALVAPVRFSLSCLRTVANSHTIEFPQARSSGANCSRIGNEFIATDTGSHAL